MRRRAHVDANQDDILRALRSAGITARSLAAMGKGIPDILAGFRGVNVLLEVKNPAAARGTAQALELTVDEKDFHETWAGQVRVVTSPEEAVQAVVDVVGRLDGWATRMPATSVSITAL